MIKKFIIYLINMIKRKKTRTYKEVHPEIMYRINKPYSKYINFEMV